MLATNTYPHEYVDACHAMVDRQVAARRKAVTPNATGAASVFEPLFFQALVLELDRCFVHRTRAQEGKDGNALNEVWLLCSSILEHDGVFTGEKAIKWTPEASVLGYAEGDAIAIDADGFARLAAAFFGGIEDKFS